MKTLHIVILSCFIYSGSFSQSRAKSLFLELGGVSGHTSINYDMRFAKKQDGLGFRVGIGKVWSNYLSVTNLPIMINYLKGNNGNYLEAGAGVCLVATEGGNTSEDFRDHYFALNLGYRYQPVAKKIMLRVTLTPVFGRHFSVPYYGGVSIGYQL